MEKMTYRGTVDQPNTDGHLNPPWNTERELEGSKHMSPRIRRYEKVTNNLPSHIRESKASFNPSSTGLQFQLA